MAQIITSVTLSDVVRPDVGGARRRRRRCAGTVTYCAGARGRQRRGILTSGTERACGSVWLVIWPQAKHRVRALSRVHITSQGPRPSLCRVRTVIFGGALGTEISSQQATKFFKMHSS